MAVRTYIILLCFWTSIEIGRMSIELHVLGPYLPSNTSMSSMFSNMV